MHEPVTSNAGSEWRARHHSALAGKNSLNLRPPAYIRALRLRTLTLLASDTYDEDAISAATGASILRASEYQKAREALGNVSQLQPRYAYRTSIILTRISRGIFRASRRRGRISKELYAMRMWRKEIPERCQAYPNCTLSTEK
ncbi:hypothetical protein B0H19DRAFT_1081562 [Mycena capillaripes]|nr:hypothetical protein B0H19DRAFT_1081562 [Mycena capillaripes]